jgi:hypothetical protein
VPYTIAHLLDWGNEKLVGWYLRGTQSAPDPERIHRYMSAPPETLFPAPRELPTFSPGPVGKAAAAEGALAEVRADAPAPRGRRIGWLASEEIWEAAAPWHGAEEPNARWIASRIPAAGRGRSETEVPGNAPAVILLHGWLAVRMHVGHYLRLAWWLARRGVEVWMPRLPFHLERTPAGTFSGNLCLSADLEGNAEALRQAVSETRALAAWLRERGAPAVGLWGTSLGGWVAGLAATTEPGWDAVALWAPVASAPQVLWGANLVREIRRTVRRSGIRPADEGRWSLNLSPVERRLMVERDRVFLVAGIYDNVVFPRSIAELARAWRVGVYWLPHGHISLMASFANTRSTIDCLDRLLHNKAR